MEYEKKAVGHTQDWSDPELAIEKIERATAAREQLAAGTSWFDKLVKRAPEPAGETSDDADASPSADRKASRKRRGSQKG